LRDWRRMNVALTRAKHGLIILGDLETLAEKDKHWSSLLKWGRGVRCIVDDSYHDDDDEEASP
jgi:superfamily I DNA and/or RNA helicase